MQKRQFTPLFLLLIAGATALLQHLAHRSDDTGDALVSPWRTAPERHSALALTGRAFDGSGHLWSLAGERGRIVLVNEAATWCGPCRREAPALAHLRAHFPAEKVLLVGLLWDEGSDLALTEAARRFAVEVGGVPYPLFRARPDPTAALNGVALPTTLLIDRQGRLVRTYIGPISERTVAADVARLLQE